MICLACCSAFPSLIRYVFVFFLPIVGLTCGKMCLISFVSILFLNFIASSAINSVNKYGSWIFSVVKDAVLLVLLCAPLKFIPKWVLSLTEVIIDYSPVVWCLIEAIALFHTISLVSAFLTPMLTEEATETSTKIIMAGLSVATYAASSVVLYWLSQIDDWWHWYAMALLPLVIASHYLMYQRDRGNIVDTSLMLCTSVLLLYSVYLEIELYAQTKMTADSVHVERLNQPDATMLHTLWRAVLHAPGYFSMNVQLWKSLLSPLPVAKLAFTVYSALRIHWSLRQYGDAKTETVDLVEDDMPQRFDYLSFVVMLIVAHSLLPYFPEEAADSAYRWFASQGGRLRLYRLAQSAIMNILYIYCLSQEDDD